jgi:beta-glucosidase/6-phospho-beta-glucosidase/beta-galactosidase
MIQLAKGILRTVQALKKIDPNSVMVHVEATGLSRAARQDLQVLASEEQRRGYLCYDLLTGRVDPNHPLFTWLIRNGASPDDLTSIRRQKIKLDVIGLNFYPQWSAQEIHINRRGRIAYRAVESKGTDFSNMIEDYYNRYGVPIIITETSAYGKDEARSEWLKTSVAAVKNLRGQGVPVLGYTWFPLFTMIDWRYRFGRGPLENYRLELGLYKLNGQDGKGRWQPTPLVDQFRSFIKNSAEAIGTLALVNNQ